MLGSLLDLVLPRACGGCSAPATQWCAECDGALDELPVTLSPRVEVGVPCFALGDYEGPRRSAVVALKERGRTDLVRPVGRALARAVLRLRDAGEIDAWQLSPLRIVPAPTRRAAARRRGGDPVHRTCTEAADYLGRIRYPDSRTETATVAPMVTLSGRVRDSVGLSARARRENIEGRVRVRPPVDSAAPWTTVLVDDVLTTGTTASETVRALGHRGVNVDAVLVVASVR